VLIAYPDHLQRAGEAPLATLAAWCHAHLANLVSTVHVLPFHPSTSYDGYAISDFMSVDSKFGTWDDLARLAPRFELMIDLVLNHCSASHPWFTQFLANEEPGRRYFITVDDPGAPWLDVVARARDLPLLHEFTTAAGPRHVWTTYSPDLIDVNWHEPDVLAEFVEILFDGIVHGARMVRLDAFVYTWKERGTNCVARPATHDLLRLLQDVLREAGASAVAVLPSITNVTQARNFEYLGPTDEARQADLIYHLPLSALLLLSLYTGDATVLARWLAALPPAPPGRAYLNLAATHDGVGLTWIADLLPPETIRTLIADAKARGALLSTRHVTAHGAEVPWEINTTYFSACAGDDHVARFLATQSVVLALRGVPALYFSLFVAGENNHAAAAASGDNRDINRGRFSADAWERAVADPASPHAAVLAGLQRMLAARRECSAFHPEASQRIVDVGNPGVLVIERDARMRCATNFSSQSVTIGRYGRDVLSGDVDDSVLAPYQVRWSIRS